MYASKVIGNFESNTDVLCFLCELLLTIGCIREILFILALFISYVSNVDRLLFIGTGVTIAGTGSAKYLL
jgi:hypothetical protein